MTGKITNCDDVEDQGQITKKRDLQGQYLRSILRINFPLKNIPKSRKFKQKLCFWENRFSFSHDLKHFAYIFFFYFLSILRKFDFPKRNKYSKKSEIFFTALYYLQHPAALYGHFRTLSFYYVFLVQNPYRIMKIIFFTKIIFKISFLIIKKKTLQN